MTDGDGTIYLAEGGKGWVKREEVKKQEVKRQEVKRQEVKRQENGFYAAHRIRSAFSILRIKAS